MKSEASLKQTSRVTASDLLLGGWHRITYSEGILWAYPKILGDCTFQKAAEWFRAGMRDE